MELNPYEIDQDLCLNNNLSNVLKFITRNIIIYNLGTVRDKHDIKTDPHVHVLLACFVPVCQMPLMSYITCFYLWRHW